MAPDDPKVSIATAYLRHSIYEYNQRDSEAQWRSTLDEVTDVTGDVFMGLSMQCAHCHDHKFDPILQKDYYRSRRSLATSLGARTNSSRHLRKRRPTMSR